MGLGPCPGGLHWHAEVDLPLEGLTYEAIIKEKNNCMLVSSWQTTKISQRNFCEEEKNEKACYNNNKS